MKKLVLFFSLLIVNYSLSIASVRYVSHLGSNTPPYLTWETAADSIMSTINISSFGDTIYVANGVYEEQVVMIPGLSLIGAGMDSCIIDTRNLSGPWPFITVAITDTCLLKGFNIVVANNPVDEYGISDNGSRGSTVTMNKISSSGIGIEVNNMVTSNNSDLYIYKNIIQDVNFGIDVFTSNAIVRMNTVIPKRNPQSGGVTGIEIGAYFYNYYPIIDSNYIYLEHGTNISLPLGYAIYKSYGARPLITHNTLICSGNQFWGMFLSYADSGWVKNNLIIANTKKRGIENTGIEYLKLYNNYLTGYYGDQNYAAIQIGSNNDVRNNVVTNAVTGIRAWGTQNLSLKYNNVWNCETNYTGVTPDSTNISVDPMVVNDDSTKGELDFHLQAFSPLIDAGDPDILDKDGTRSDIGLYGGPFGDMYKYQDLPPRVPVNLTASVDTDYISLSWNKNTEADFSNYNLYRDTTADFTADSTTFVASVEDTFYLHIRPEGINNLYFKLTAEDNQGNVSEPSEELHIVLTGTKSNEEFTIKDYKLFQNYPNPFNPSTKIGYRLKERGYVKLYVYDVKGELVETLVNQFQEGGFYEVEFRPSSANTESGILKLASGIYIYQLMVRSENNIPVFSDIKKMILLK